MKKTIKKPLVKAQKGKITNNAYTRTPVYVVKNKQKIYGTRNDGGKLGTDYTPAQKWGSTLPGEKTSVVKSTGKKVATKSVPKSPAKKVNPSMKQGVSAAVLNKTGTSSSTLSRAGFTPAPPRSISAYESDPNYRETMRKIKGPDESTYSKDKMTKTKTPIKPKGKTVAEVWKDKTGMSWSEAKKLGYSDGSASGNIKLLKKLNAGEITRNSIKGYDKAAEPVNPTISPKALTTSGGSGMGAIEREAAMMEQTYKKGGSVKKYRKVNVGSKSKKR